MATGLSLAWTLARRELRGGLRGLRVVLACLALGVAAIATVGGLRASITEAIRTDGRRILGGDLEIRTGQRPLPDAARAWIAARNGRISEIVTLRSMLIAEGGARLLVELKAVDPAWPLVGSADTVQSGAVRVDPLVLQQLDIQPGAQVRLGDAHLVLAGSATAEPDSASGFALFGPRVLMALGDLPATNLLQPGALMNYDTRIVFPAGTDITAMQHDIQRDFANEGWRVRDAQNAAPGIARFIDTTTLFMTLAGLTSLLVGGIGVANGVRAWMTARARSIATLRCLGAPRAVLFASGLMQIGLLSAIGILMGGVIGVIAPYAIGATIADLLPVAPKVGFYPRPVLLAMTCGALTAAIFALWPLSRAADIPGAALFRDVILPSRTRPRIGLVLTTLTLVALLVGLIIGTAHEPRFALMFCLGAAMTLLIYRLAAWAVMVLAHRLRSVRSPVWRLALANLHRPGAATPTMLLSLGVGLATLASMALIEGSVSATVSEQMPRTAPSFYFIDIQTAQADAFDAITATIPGAQGLHRVPSLRARIVAVNDTPVEQLTVSPDSAWALRGDRGLTYAATPPEGTRIVDGTWWPADYRGPPLVSFDAALAKGWGVWIGDTITVNVLGRNITLRIASLRDIAWRTLGMNFALVASPGFLEAAPHTFIATIHVPPEQEAALLRKVTDAFGNVSGIRVRDALETVQRLLGQISTALGLTGLVALLSGTLVLASAIAAGQRRRIRDAVLLKTLGVPRAAIRRVFLVEFGVLGLASGVLAALIGSVTAWAVTVYVMNAEWVFLPARLIAILGICTGFVLLAGWFGTSRALRIPAAPLLRNE